MRRWGCSCAERQSFGSFSGEALFYFTRGVKVVVEKAGSKKMKVLYFTFIEIRLGNVNSHIDIRNKHLIIFEISTREAVVCLISCRGE